MKILIIIFALAFNSTIILSQSAYKDARAIIVGKVLDYSSKKPVSDCFIFISPENDFQTSSDSGTFMFNNLPLNTYVITYSNYNCPETSDTITLDKVGRRKINKLLLDYEDEKAQLAERDFKENNMKLYFGGWPIFNIPLDVKNSIAKKYGFVYVFDGGCDPTTFYWNKYNSKIKSYLTERNGPDWEKRLKKEIEEFWEINKPVINKDYGRPEREINNTSKTILDSL